MKFGIEAQREAILGGPTMRRRGHKETFGGTIEHNQDNVCRIGCRNIGGFPNEEMHSEKYDVLREESAENGLGFDIQSFIEVNRRREKIQGCYERLVEQSKYNTIMAG